MLTRLEIGTEMVRQLCNYTTRVAWMHVTAELALVVHCAPEFSSCASEGLLQSPSHFALGVCALN